MVVPPEVVPPLVVVVVPPEVPPLVVVVVPPVVVLPDVEEVVLVSPPDVLVDEPPLLPPEVELLPELLSLPPLELAVLAAIWFDALPTANETLLPSASAAPPRPTLTIARISAYSAAEAPLSSFRNRRIASLP